MRNLVWRIFVFCLLILVSAGGFNLLCLFPPGVYSVLLHGLSSAHGCLHIHTTCPHFTPNRTTTGQNLDRLDNETTTTTTRSKIRKEIQKKTKKKTENRPRKDHFPNRCTTNHGSTRRTPRSASSCPYTAMARKSAATRIFRAAGSTPAQERPRTAPYRLRPQEKRSPPTCPRRRRRCQQ